MRKHKRKNCVREVYDSVNREALWQVLRMHDVGDKLLGGIKSIYVDSLACVRVKEGVSEWFKIDSGVRQGCIMSTWIFNVYIDAEMKEVKTEMGRRGVRFLEDGREWRLPGFLDANDLVLHGELEEDVRAMLGQSAEVYK